MLPAGGQVNALRVFVSITRAARIGSSRLSRPQLAKIFLSRLAWSTTLIGLFVCVLSATAQNSVNCAWNAETGNSVAGYRFYEGLASRQYSDSIDAMTLTNITISGLASGFTYFFAVTAYDSTGQESDYSDEISYVVPVLSNSSAGTVLLAPGSGSIMGPFVTNGSVIYQTSQTGVTNGGQATYSFFLPKQGDYLVSASVNAPAQSWNSFFVNIDAEPTDPTMIWDIPPATGFTNRIVSWRGKGTFDNDEFVPKVFTLASGRHQLIVRGRGANAQLGTITISPAPSQPQPILQISVTSDRQVRLSGFGPTGHTYDVLAAEDLAAWKIIGHTTTDVSGSFRFTDPKPAILSSRWYLLQEPLAPPTFQVNLTPDWEALLTGTAPIGHTYNIQASEDSINWTTIGTVTMDGTGSFQFIDWGSIYFPDRVYRLQESPTAPTLGEPYWINGFFVLTGTGPTGQFYDVQASEDLATWEDIGLVWINFSGSFEFLDWASRAHPLRFYRLHGNAP